MGRFLLGAATGALSLALLLGGGAFLITRGVISPRVAEAAVLGPMAPWAAEIPAEIRDLHNLPPEQRFNHFLGGQMRFSDTNDKAHTVSAVPGTVTSVGDKSVSIKANDEAVGNKSFKITDETRIHTAGRPWGESGQTTPKSGDKVVVMTFDSNDEAKAVIVGGPDGFRPRGGPWHRN